ncbi:MAG: GTPase HflX, partial [Candidatus Bathyarchaeia archaeon]
MSPQPVVLVERLAPGQTSLLDELKNLAETVDCEVSGCLRQVRVQDSAFQIGRGKAEELGKTVRELAATKV